MFASLVDFSVIIGGVTLFGLIGAALGLAERFLGR
jgi:hypothetical protein